MTLKIKASTQRAERVPMDSDDVYNLLKAIDNSAQFFPRVASITALGNNRFQWTLEPMGTQKYQHRVEYASEWEFNDAQRTIRWRPLPDIGNTRISGVWSIEPGSSMTRLALEIKAELILDLPRWMQLVAEPIVQTEFQKLLNRYFDNVVKHCRNAEHATP